MDKRSIPTNIIVDIKRLIVELEKDNIRIDRAILFGSHVQGTASEYSDIDVALVSPDFTGMRFLDNQRICKTTLRVNRWIETHPFTREDFLNSPFAQDEILKHGIDVK